MNAPNEQPAGVAVDRDVRRLVDEGLLYFERAGDSGDKQYVAAIRAELDRLRAENERMRGGLANVLDWALVERAPLRAQEIASIRRALTPNAYSIPD